MKQCNRCKLFKELEAFSKCKSTKDGFNKRCKQCAKELYKLNLDKYRTKVTQQKRKYRATPKGREITNKATSKWQYKNRAKLAIYSRIRCKTDPEFKIKKLLRTRIYNALKRQQKSLSAISNLGCSIVEFQNYIESKFQPGMTWENWNRYGWHIDHIRPLASFNLTNPLEFQQAVHYTNLQPLWAIDNIKKSDKYDKVS